MPFVILPWAVLDDDALTAHDLLVYATIARYADRNTGEAWPSRATVARMARCDVKTVDRAVGRLQAAGFLEKHNRKTVLGNDSNLYIIHEIKAAGGRDSNGAGVGTQTVPGVGTQTVHELEPTELDKPLDYSTPGDVAEWTPMPADVRAMLTPSDTGDTA
jgi:DNA-binding transcriptional regulator YhcF (GntR family)